MLSSVAQSCPALCDPMDCSTPGFPVFHSLLELAQTHVHRVSDAIFYLNFIYYIMDRSLNYDSKMPGVLMGFLGQNLNTLILII